MPSSHSGNSICEPGQRTFTDAELDQRHHALMDQLGECYVESDLSGKFTFVNQAYCQTFGISADERLGNSYKTIFRPDVAQAFREAYNKVYRTGETAKLSYSLELKNGKQAFIEQSISLRKDDQGKPVGFMVIIRDCFERKQHEIELMKARQAAEAASRAKSEFLANMSHEIRTPLNGVVGMLELARSTNPPPEQREFLEIAREAAESLLSVINDILDFSKIEAGRLELEEVPFDVAETIKRATQIMSASAEKKQLELIYEFAPDIPRLLLGDPVRFKQVLLNLLSNAIKFTQHGRIRVTAHARKTSNDNDKVVVHCSVADSGIGIPAEKQIAIFEAFSQADASTTRKFGGTGLGLAISSSIVHAMGGDIRVESEPGIGSTFHFHVTLEAAKHGSSRMEPPAVIASATAAIRGLNILLAEDNLINQKLAVGLLTRLGHCVVVAVNGIDALAKLKEQKFDLVFMDVQMPEMDGLAATVAIRTQEEATGPRTTIIAMTAHAIKGDRELCLEAGMDDYLAKPISSEAINAVIQRTVGAKRHHAVNDVAVVTS